ncbi:hypothetical protein AQ914_18625 [Burkholderia pseudomallei]|uniref:hypothetical protein n=1 Tax=Burkholderia pseudomallei TaxID=28450 RepID=UPI0009770F22|nr:hypothetical protein [Burkholderia pseudomallei]ONC41442.1 hypothetical protein AQ914_18625 [Burkholderia pseudomallei]
MCGLQVVEDVCSKMRDTFERVLTISDIDGTSGTCLHAAILLQQSLEQFAACGAVVRGGDGAGDGGALDAMGTWHGHYWVEGESEDGCPFVADITADQFGWPPVVVLPLEAARERYQPGDDATCRLAVNDELERMLSAVALEK